MKNSMFISMWIGFIIGGLISLVLFNNPLNTFIIVLSETGVLFTVWLVNKRVQRNKNGN